MPKILEAVDVVIVGAGAAGSVYAATLAEAGKSVIVLERGAARELTDLYSSQVWARRLKWGGPNVIERGGDSIWNNFNSGHGYGGAAIHHYGVWPRFHEEDFRERSLYGRSLDWPFEYSELRPFYDQVQREVGISGDAKKEVWRPPGEAYPLPPLSVTNHGSVLARGFDALSLRTSPIPIAILSQPYNGRPACLYDGWCDAGCPIGALANPLIVYIPRARTAGAQFRANAAVTRVLTDKAGKRATGVEYFTAAGEQVVQPARVVVLCAFTVENARLLLNSRSGAHPQGLANSSGMVGRYLMSHSAVMVYGMFPDEMQNYLGATGGQLLCQDAFGKTSHNGGGFGSRHWEIALILKPNDLLGVAMSNPSVFGDELHTFMQDGARHMGSMVGVCEDEPLIDNRIELAEETDQHGMRLARVTYKASPSASQLWAEAADEGVKIFKAAGAREAWHGPRGGQHIMGGTILGSDRANSVLNANAQSHDLANLFVGGPSVFATSSAANSTFTVHAVAMKSASFLANNWSAFA
ncbi:MAG TPA: GMC family oxidoreductase [Steroidobacteraceae bacterium]